MRGQQSPTERDRKRHSFIQMMKQVREAESTKLLFDEWNGAGFHHHEDHESAAIEEHMQCSSQFLLNSSLSILSSILFHHNSLIVHLLFKFHFCSSSPPPPPPPDCGTCLLHLVIAESCSPKLTAVYSLQRFQSTRPQSDVVAPYFATFSILTCRHHRESVVMDFPVRVVEFFFSKYYYHHLM